MLECYKGMCARDKRFKPCKAITDSVRASASKAYETYGSIEAIEAIMLKAEASEFILQNPNLCRFSWLIKPDSLNGLDEGAYEDKAKPQRQQTYAPRVDNGAFDINDLPPIPTQ